tara:strand:+ start:8716 stop:9351 length:636 start_codon:yes stop_codon:yes gene_type:complete
MNILYDYETNLTGVKGSFEDLPITNEAQEELNFWFKTKEDDVKAYPRLKIYWDNVNFGDNWSPTGTPWSAAFITYLLRNTGFPKNRAAHYLYIKDIIDGKNPTWSAFSIAKTDNLQLNVGDVLIKPRTGSNTSTHGDLVYKIEDGKAFLIGGNVSNTAKVTKVFNVDENGIVQDKIERYVIILKKKKSFSTIGIITLLSLSALVVLPKVLK